MPALFLRILVLDPDWERRVEAINNLANIGCREVFVAANSTQAIAVLEQMGAMDIALCDMGGDGADTLRFLQDAGVAGLLRSFIVTCNLSEELKAIIVQLSAVLGVSYLGAINASSNYELLCAAVTRYWGRLHSETPLTPNEGVFASEKDVRDAIFTEQIISYFQPKFNLVTGEVLGVEVLARWNHPIRGVLSPYYFLPTIRRSGLLNDLLSLQVQQGLALQRQALKGGNRLTVSFNIEAAQLINKEFLESMRKNLTDYQEINGQVIFELTENGILEDHISSVDSLVQLRDMGCGISIDDFGSGFSSLHRLCELPFTEIKLDSEFVKDLNQGIKCRAIIRGTLALAEALNIPVVVEGVETEEQRRILVDMGVTYGQGFFCARPLDHRSFLEWLYTYNLSRNERLLRYVN